MTDAERNFARTAEAQSTAADPGVSAWVSANAGAGKTHVLKTRVLRLLLAGSDPERILCLTYTKAAAAEMEQRVFADLATWATMPDEKLRSALHELLGQRATTEEEARARRLFARAIETPGGLKVQTIHAFCERLLQRFPLEAFVPPGFAILDDEMGRRLRRESIDDVLRDATSGHDPALADALTAVVVHAQGERFEDLMASALAERGWFDAINRLGESIEDGLAVLETLYRGTLGLAARDTPESLTADLLKIIDTASLQQAARILSGGAKTDQRLAGCLAEAARTTAGARLAALTSAFLTEKREARSDRAFITKAIQDSEPGLTDSLRKARDRFAERLARRDAARAVEATMALVRLASAVRERYVAAKAARAVLDFDDLIVRTVSLLSGQDMTAWVLYKLDGGIDHILVDEAQDTSPEQWRIVESLAREFFAGQGANEKVRTIFAVGDEKQSIYSFQGADPQKFAAMGAYFETAAKSSGQDWRRVALELSFRTVPTVLRAVDSVFADPGRTPGVTANAGQIRHEAKRIGHAGLVEIWDPEPFEAPVPSPAFDPLGERPPSSAVRRLADRIADTILGWLEREETLASTGRAIEPGDIMILVRRRRPFAPIMVAALKARGIPVAGADRMVLGEQLAVKDLVALAQVLALPEDDLSLAAVLKSPLFDLDDDALIAIAPDRPGSLYKALLAAAKTDDRFVPAAEQLKSWRQIADYLPPYEMFVQILDRDGGRRKLLSRLGPEAAEAIDEFLDLALAYDDRAPPSLAGFLTALAETRHEIKRDLEHGQNQVRVLTVHGAKGLEAPIVFLPDTCQTGRARGSGLVGLDIERPAGITPPCLWTVAGAGRLPVVARARDAAGTSEGEESNRLLYVAMTRARDRLYVAGWETAQKRNAACWYEKIKDALADGMTSVGRGDGTSIHRLEDPQTAAAEDKRKAGEQAVAAEPPPRWASTLPAAEPRAVIPVAPSRLAPLDVDEEGEPLPPAPRGGSERNVREPAAPSPATLSADNRFLRGTLTHALLEHLPNLPPDTWDAAAQGFLATRGGALSAAMRASIVTETLAVLRDPTFSPVFAPGSRAEVPLVARLRDPTGRRPDLHINGQIDRLALIDGGVLIVDYKTNRPPPSVVEGVPLAYMLQMAAYRLALREIYPGHTVTAAILWTYGTRLMPIPEAALDAIQPRLWELAASP